MSLDRLLGGITAGVLLVAGLTGCGSGGERRTTSPRPSTTAAFSVADSQALDAYRRMWTAYAAAAAVPDPDNQDVKRYATDDALRIMTDGLRLLRQQGLKGTGTVVPAPEVVSSPPAGSPDQVSIRDCLDTSGSHIISASPGGVYQDTPGGRRQCFALVHRQGDGSWKVATFDLRDVGTC